MGIESVCEPYNTPEHSSRHFQAGNDCRGGNSAVGDSTPQTFSNKFMVGRSALHCSDSSVEHFQHDVPLSLIFIAFCSIRQNLNSYHSGRFFLDVKTGYLV